MSRRRNGLLLLLVLVAGIATAISQARLTRARAASVAMQKDLVLCRQQLSDLHRWRSRPDADVAAAPDTSQLSRLLRQAAADAGAEQRLASIEPGQPSAQSADYAQLLVFLRLESISLKELTMFLYRLGSIDPTSRAQSIELSAAGSHDHAERWNADVTVAYLSLSPSGRSP